MFNNQLAETTISQPAKELTEISLLVKKLLVMLPVPQKKYTDEILEQLEQTFYVQLVILVEKLQQNPEKALECLSGFISQNSIKPELPFTIIHALSLPLLEIFELKNQQRREKITDQLILLSKILRENITSENQQKTREFIYQTADLIARFGLRLQEHSDLNNSKKCTAESQKYTQLESILITHLFNNVLITFSGLAKPYDNEALEKIEKYFSEHLEILVKKLQEKPEEALGWITSEYDKFFSYKLYQYNLLLVIDLSIKSFKLKDPEIRQKITDQFILFSQILRTDLKSIKIEHLKNVYQIAELIKEFGMLLLSEDLNNAKKCLEEHRAYINHRELMDTYSVQNKIIPCTTADLDLLQSHIELSTKIAIKENNFSQIEKIINDSEFVYEASKQLIPTLRKNLVESYYSVGQYFFKEKNYFKAVIYIQLAQDFNNYAIKKFKAKNSNDFFQKFTEATRIPKESILDLAYLDQKKIESNLKEAKSLLYSERVNLINQSLSNYYWVKVTHESYGTTTLYLELNKAHKSNSKKYFKDILKFLKQNNIYHESYNNKFPLALFGVLDYSPEKLQQFLNLLNTLVISNKIELSRNEELDLDLITSSQKIINDLTKHQQQDKNTSEEFIQIDTIVLDNTDKEKHQEKTKERNCRSFIKEKPIVQDKKINHNESSFLNSIHYQEKKPEKFNGTWNNKEFADDLVIDLNYKKKDGLKVYAKLDEKKLAKIDKHTYEQFDHALRQNTTVGRFGVGIKFFTLENRNKTKVKEIKNLDKSYDAKIKIRSNKRLYGRSVTKGKNINNEDCILYNFDNLVSKAHTSK